MDFRRVAMASGAGAFLVLGFMGVTRIDMWRQDWSRSPLAARRLDLAESHFRFLRWLFAPCLTACAVALVGAGVQAAL